MVAALRSSTQTAADLAHLYGREDDLSAAELAYAAQLIEQAGARAWAEAEAEDQLARAFAQLRCAELDRPAAAELTALARLVTARDR